MDLRTFRQFLAVIEHGTIGGAAKELHITQPALSKSIRKLEDEWQVPLLERTPRGVIPTEIGTTLSKYFQLIESELRRAKIEVEALKGSSKGHLLLGVGPISSWTVAPKMIENLLATHKDITISAVEGLGHTLGEALVNGELDMIIGSALEDSAAPLVQNEKLFCDRASVVVRQEHPGVSQLKKGEISKNELEKLEWILTPRGDPMRSLLEIHFQKVGLSRPTPRIETNSIHLIKKTLATSDLASYLPESAINKIDSPLLLSINQPTISAELTTKVYYRDKKWLPVVARTAIQILLETVYPISPSRTD